MFRETNIRRKGLPGDVRAVHVHQVVRLLKRGADANALAWTFEAEGDAPTMWERATAAIDGIIARE